MRRQPGKIIDLFAGAGGWEQALAWLDLEAVGIETDGHACETARAAGFDRLQADVAEVDPVSLGPVWGLLGSPPCQAYSTAGKGLSRADKPIVVACAHELAAGDDSRRAWREGCRDPRSLLTVEPLRYILALRPRWVALEQVPAVPELWSTFAALLTPHGYHTATGVLSAERYGVPQTRKRAFLIASLDGPVALPDATHRSYNPRRTETPAEDGSLLPWVSMAQALGWDSGNRVGFPHNSEPPGDRAERARDRRPASCPAKTLTTRGRPSTRRPCVEVRRGERISEGLNPTSATAPRALTNRVDCRQASVRSCGEPCVCERRSPTLTTTLRSREGALLGPQLPAGESRERGRELRSGNQAKSAVRPINTPAPTVLFGHRTNKVACLPRALDGRQNRSRPRAVDDPAPTMLAAGLAKGVPVWAGKRPATTVACDRRVHPPGHKECANDPAGRYEQRRGANAARVSVQQAAVLQGFPADFPWQGPRTRQFQQVGNAVPPPLALHVIRSATAAGKGRKQ